MPTLVARDRIRAVCLAGLGVVVLTASILTSCRAQSPTTDQAVPSAVVERLDRDIELLQIINRLSLSRDQAQRLIEIAGQMQQERQATDAAYAELAPLLKEKMGYLLRDEPVPESLSAKIQQARQHLDELRDEVLSQQVQHVDEVREVLSEPQILIISGGDQARQAALEMLMWIRELSAEDFHSEAMPNAEQLADPEQGLDVDTVYEIFQTAYNLEPDEYHTQDEELASRLAPLFRTGTAHDDIAVIDLMTDDRFVPVLKRRAEYLTDGGGAG
ncbi:MAG: hypothetical protein ACLFWB_11955 [Armatimonadota bacterium]